MRFYPFESDDAKDAFFDGLEKMYCSGEYSNMNSCISECDSLTFGEAENKIEYRNYNFSYNGYKPDDLITVKFLELADKLQKSGQNDFLDKLVGITSDTLLPSFGECDINFTKGCSVLATIYDVIIGPLEAQLDETETKKIVEKLNKEKGNLNAQIEKLTKENAGSQQLSQLIKTLEQEKAGLLDKIEDFTQQNNTLCNDYNEYRSGLGSDPIDCII